MTLYELLQNNSNEEDSILSMDEIYSRIREAYHNGDNFVSFSHGNAIFPDEISEGQVNILRGDGYTVRWERGCLWYEVSGWK